VMEHAAPAEKGGASKLVPACTLPLTGKACVHYIITDLGEFDLLQQGREGQLTLVELAPGVTLDEIKSKTTADYAVADSLKKRAA